MAPPIQQYAEHMSRDDELHPVPSIVPKRDSDHHYATSRSRGKGTTTNRPGPAAGGSGGSSGLLSRLLITVALVIAAVACAWAWQLQQQLAQADSQIEAAAGRIADLEDLLSDTDETVNQSAAAMRAQLKMLDTEVRKLWDARKASNAKIATLEKSSKAQGGQLASLDKSDKANTAQVKALDAEIAKLKGVAGDLERLMASGKRNQSEVERLADTLNKYELENAKLSKRVADNEGWVESINTSRRQVNAKITQLETAIRNLQAGGQ